MAWINARPCVQSLSKTNGGFGRRTNFADGVMLPNNPGPGSGAGSAGDGVVVGFSMMDKRRERVASIAAIHASLVASDMAASRAGEEGTRFEVGDAGVLSELSELSMPNFAILVS